MIAFCNGWVVLSLVLFYFGPIEWQGASTPDVAVYVLLCLLAFNAGVRVSVRRPMRQAPIALVPRSRALALTLVSIYSGISLIVVGTVTGKSVFETSNYSLSYAHAYDDYQSAIKHVAFPAILGLLVLGKAILFPIVLAVFVNRFRTDRLYGFLFLAPMMISSVFRGTDLEIVDIVVIFFGGAYLYGMMNGRRLLYPFAATIGALELFLVRRIDRFGGDLPQCIPESKACFNPDSFVARNFGQNTEVLTVFLTNYITNGYQGLSYALHLRWNPNWGFGHLPTLGNTLCQYVNSCPGTNYQQELTTFGWDSQERWTTAYTVIANDFSFLLVPLYLFFLGVVTRRCLSAWRATQDPAAGAGLILILIFWLYSSANMHLAITLDWAVATVFLLYVAPWRHVDQQEVTDGALRQELSA